MKRRYYQSSIKNSAKNVKIQLKIHDLTIKVNNRILVQNKRGRRN